MVSFSTHTCRQQNTRTRAFNSHRTTHLHHAHAHTGKSWTLDMDFGTAPSDVALGYLTLLAIDSLLNVVMTQEMLVDR